MNPAVQQEILERVNRLTPETKAVWGKMNALQAVRHMAMGFTIPTGELDPTPANVIKMPKWLLKFFLLNIKPTKASIDTFLELNMFDNKVDVTNLESEKDYFKLKLQALTDCSQMIPENKIAGKFSRNDWGKLNYNHADHHLRQFGV